MSVQSVRFAFPSYYWYMPKPNMAKYREGAEWCNKCYGSGEVDDWMGRKKIRCPRCNGHGVKPYWLAGTNHREKCRVCNGKGRVDTWASSETCWECKGEGYVFPWAADSE